MTEHKKVMLATVILKSVDSQVYASHLTFAYRCGRECPDYDFWIATPQRWAIDSARNLVVQTCINYNIDYLFFYDDDTYLEKSGMKQMLEVMETHPEVHVLSGHYLIRGYPFPLMAFIEDEKEKLKWRHITQEEAEHLTSNGLIGPLKAVGNGCTLYRVELFKKIDTHKKPEDRIWFKTIMHQVTEDIFFFAKMHNQLENVGVYMMSNLVMGHQIADRDIVDKANVKILKERWERDAAFIQRHNIDGLEEKDCS